VAGLVVGAGKTDVATLAELVIVVQLSLLLVVNLSEELVEVGIVDGGDRGETRTELVIVGTDEAVVTGHTNKGDVILNDHDITDLEALIKTTSSVGHDDSLDTEGSHNLDTEHGVLGGPTLVEVETTAEADDILGTKLTDDELILVTHNSGVREVGKFGVIDDNGVDNLSGKVGQARTADNTDIEVEGHLLVNSLDDCRDVSVSHRMYWSNVSRTGKQ